VTAAGARRLAAHIGRPALSCRARVSAGPGARYTVRVTDLRDGRGLFVAAPEEWAAHGPAGGGADAPSAAGRAGAAP
jgi:hypothetical protein